MSIESSRSFGDEALVVATPLDLISQLEDQGNAIGTVVLKGGFATNCELATFLDEFYPSVSIVCEAEGS